MFLFTAFHILGTSLDRGHHNGVRIPHSGRITHRPLAIKHEAHRACFAKVAAMFGKKRAHIAGGAVAVVGHRLDNHRNTIGPIAFIADLFIGLALATNSLLDCPFDIVLGHRLALGLFHRQTQAGVFLRIRVTHLCGHRDLLGELGEKLGAQLVLTPFTVLNICPFGMACHGLLLITR